MSEDLRTVFFFLLQKCDWTMHKLECSAMCSFGESWCPSETVRLVARIINRMVSAEGFTKENVCQRRVRMSDSLI